MDPSALKYSSTIPPYTAAQYTHSVERIMEVDPDVWDIFSDFVDTIQYPTYYNYVEVGMCLELILERLKSSYYCTETSFLADVEMIVQNAAKFNGQDSYI